MRKPFFYCVMLLACICTVTAQQTDKYPLGDYTELTDTKPYDDPEVWNRLSEQTSLSWGSIDVRYPKLSVPQVIKTARWQTKAWKGERVNAQAVLWTKTDLQDASIAVSDLKNGSAIIPSSAATAGFLRYVMTDELSKDRTTGCGHRENKAEWDSSMVADAIDIIKVREVKAMTTQPIWLNVWVPRETKPGKYKGTLTVSGRNLAPMNLQIEIEVINRTLPAPKDWAFHLDLWQNPYAVARYHQVPLWSREHFDAMLPVMKILANIGQKVITTSIMHRPWAGQTEDHFDSMISRMKKLDGSWAYDYTVFDKWVEFMMYEVGIDQQIGCYTLIPWALKFDYFDQATNRVVFLETKPGEAAYEDYWGSFLKDFARHLKQKGWFDKTVISMDERGMEPMKEAIKVIRKADPNFKISLAGNYHAEIEADLYDYSLAYGQNFSPEEKEARDKAGKISRVYTCCAEALPNIFTFSPPAEATWTIWHAVAGNYSGYLRWAYNSWTQDPLRDSRFRTWAAGDCYMVYPGVRSSIRMERLTEGLQDAEKIRILREEFTAKGQKSKLNRLNAIVSEFMPDRLTHENAAEMINGARKVLNGF
ncbi:DUF4091 domain-containing protein [Parabacteroides sp. PF5-9]|uniref:DUF4091 domain-containing protein n=1 Tax=Parabacteroides sp. PF5-9 TaxID=1742404 RepID=UPI0024766724|nr:DUF4091 domain-containing protein [Parabacteroides sp. PF5-9]MDH6359177.1 hypothetical protein [Parabacteroides sp. PF5-9]